MSGGNSRGISTSAAVLLLCAGWGRTNEVRRLKLEEAVRLALEQNRTLKMARLKIKENEFRKGEARSDYFPTITNQSNALHISELQNVVIPQEALGTPAGGPVPSQGISFQQANQTPLSTGP